jgi:hypothetical protein
MHATAERQRDGPDRMVFSVEIVALGNLNLRRAGSAGVSPARRQKAACLAKTIANIGDEEHFLSRNNAVILSLGRRDA